MAVIEIALNATSADGRPLVATMPLQAPEPSVEDILRQGQRDGELREQSGGDWEAPPPGQEAGGIS